MKKLFFAMALLAGLFFSNNAWAQAEPTWPFEPAKDFVIITTTQSAVVKQTKCYYSITDSAGTSAPKALFEIGDSQVKTIHEQYHKNAAFIAKEFEKLTRRGYRLVTSNQNTVSTWGTYFVVTNYFFQKDR